MVQGCVSSRHKCCAKRDFSKSKQKKKQLFVLKNKSIFTKFFDFTMLTPRQFSTKRSATAKATPTGSRRSSFLPPTTKK